MTIFFIFTSIVKQVIYAFDTFQSKLAELLLVLHVTVKKERH